MPWSRDRIAKVAERTGYPVHAAWVKGHGTMGEIMGCILHHTATPNSYMPNADIPTLKVLREGRSDLAGPLCNFGLARSGAIWLITDGLGWHAGPGEYRGVTLGATHFLGIEAENGGRGATTDPWPPAQLDSYQRLVASILYEKGDKDTTWDIRHARWAKPVGRKTDTAGFDMTAFDQKVQAMLDDPRTINRNNTDPGDDMAIDDAALDAIQQRVEASLAANRTLTATAVWAATLGRGDNTKTMAQLLADAADEPELSDLRGLLTDALGEPFIDALADALSQRLGSGPGATVTKDEIHGVLLSVLNNIKISAQ